MATAYQRQYSVEERYGFIKHIDKGSYGDVWIVAPINTIDQGIRYIMKRINLHSTTSDVLDEAERETQLLSTLKHPNIIRCIESFRSRDSCFNIVIEYCENGDLYTKVKQKKSEGQMFEETKVVEWCIQICMALDYLHKRHVLHRNIKTQNIFLTKEKIIKVSDFSISKVLDDVDDLATTIIGTPYYMSPELLSSKPYGAKSDIWAFGCCIYELVSLKNAFTGLNLKSLSLEVTQGDTPIICKTYSDELKRIITSMLSKQPKDRPTAEDILRHEYIGHHIIRMTEDIKQRTLSRKENFDKTSLTEPYSSEVHIHQQQNLGAQQMLASSATMESITTLNGTQLNTNELQVWKQCPEKKLIYYLEQYEKAHEEDNHGVQGRDEFISTSNSSPATINTSAYEPTVIETTQLVNEGPHKMSFRYSDIGNLPDQVLLPVTGYNNEPLLLLEDTIQPVRHLLVSNIDAAIRVAKENAKKRHGLLSVDESAAIQLYTLETHPVERCLYFVLNKTLREVNRRKLIPWFRYLKLLMTALWKLPSVQRVVWRGIKDVNLSDQYQEGECYTWWNLSSCTGGLTVMETPQFMGKEGVRTLFNIECIDGKEIRGHSYVETENEILIPPAAYFKVIGKVDAGSHLYIIHVQQISPPYELISPPF